MFTGLKSIIYPTSDIAADVAFWTKITGVAPYVNESYYAGFTVNGCELGLDPNAAKEGLTYPVSYWNVKDAKAAAAQLIADGVTVNRELKDVGGGMMMGTFKDPSGNIFGIIDNPNA